MTQNKPVECYVCGKYMGQYLSVPDHVAFEPVVDATIQEVARAALLIARRNQKSVSVVFKNVKMSVPYEMWPNTNTNVVDVVDNYYNKAWQQMQR